ncbi:flavin-containing monooxygenase [Aliikangiella maris]|uniref:NAD(P)-binding domain-containing protein n=2 Tax=Aliikangiella maris TaxID=3162458 RepID=A0ABV3MSX9_9GAMM
MKVCVIGAGPSGLTTIKQLIDENHEVTCFEKNEDIGGIWYRTPDDKDQMKAYDNLMLTISMKMMAFSDFMHKGERTFTDHKGYLKYLQNYCEHYQLKQHIQFNSMVEEIIHQADGSWSIVVRDSNAHIKTYNFEALAVCSGPFKKPNREIPEIKNFSGNVIHSSEYRNNRNFVGKKVLVIGLAESSADILREISNVSESCTVSIRSHTFLLPRLIYGHYATDSLTTRSHHHEMWIRSTGFKYQLKSFSQDNWFLKKLFISVVNLYGLLSIPLKLIGKLFGIDHSKKTLSSINDMGQPAYPSKVDMYTENTKEVRDFIDRWNKTSHKGAGNWSQKIIFCKNVSFVPNIINGKIKVQETGIDYIDGNTVHFKDTTMQAFDTIVLCTGFLKDFSIFKNIEIKDNNVRNLYKHAFHPDCNGRLAMIGFLRPISGGIPICAEMQARYFAQLCSNNINLPDNLMERIEKEKQWEEHWMSLSPRHTESMPSQIMFLDAIAKEIGCHIPMWKLLLHPKLFVKMWFYSFNQACYRIEGPHSMREESMQEVLNEKLPLNDSLFMFAMIVLSLLPSSVHPKNISLRYVNTD